MRRLAIIALWVLASCKREQGADDRAASGPPPSPTETPSAPGEPAVAPAKDPAATTSASSLDWLDPDAVTVAYAALPPDLEVDGFAAVFSLPPQLAGMLRDVQGLGRDLQAVLPVDAPAVSTWLHPEALSFQSRFSSGTYILRRHRGSPEEVGVRLRDAGFLPQTVEGRPLYAPRGAFPWKVAVLEPDLVAFIPVRALGDGFQPLSAGRDLPPSEIETQLRQTLEHEGTPALQLYAAGPLLHLDLSQDLAQIIVGARGWQRGLDVQIQLVPTRDVEEAAKDLRDRDLSLESDRIAALASRVAYSVEGSVVLGRLQLTASDMVALRRAP